MTIADPTLWWNFRRWPGYLDPRSTFTRATTAKGVNQKGYLYTVPANAARWAYNTNTRVCDGMLVEPQRTNLMLRSEDFSHATWVKTGATVSADSYAAPDLAVAADTIDITATDGNVAQTVTTVAGRGLGVSIFARPKRSPFLWVQLTNGTDSVEGWFSLLDGLGGGQTANAPSIIVMQSYVEKYPDLWRRCTFQIATGAYTSWTVKYGPCSRAGVRPAAGDSMYLWGAQLEAEATFTNCTSYIPTTSASVTRNADNLYATVDSRWFNLTEGTIFFDIVMRETCPTLGGQSLVYGGIGATFSDTIYFGRQSDNYIGVTATTSAGSTTVNSRTTSTLIIGATNRMAFAWKSGNSALIINGSLATYSYLGPTACTRLSVGSAPWSASSQSTVGNCVYAAFGLFPRRLSDTALQALAPA